MKSSSDIPLPSTKEMRTHLCILESFNSLGADVIIATFFLKKRIENVIFILLISHVVYGTL